MVKKMCKTCKRLIKGEACPICKTSQLAESWRGRIVVIDANNSELAKRLKLTEAGEYALR